MSGHLGERSHALAMKGGTLAAATVLAGAGLFGVAAAGPQVAGAPFAQVRHDVTPTAFPTFAESLQNLLNTMGVGALNDMLGKLSDSLGVTTPFTVGTDVSDLLAALNPDGTTLAGVAGMFGISITDPLYSTTGESLLGSTNFVINGQTVPNPFVFNAPASFYTTTWGDPASNLYSSINGTPLGDVEVGKLVDLLLGGAGQGDDHTLADLASQLGFNLNQALPSLGGLTGLFSWLSGVSTYGDALNKLGGMLSNFNIEENSCSGLGLLTVCNSDYEHPTLSLTNSSLNDWLSGLLQTSTTDVTHITDSYSGGVLGHVVTTETTLPGTTLGGYLQTMPWGATGNTYLGDQSLGALLNMDPTETWNTYLSSMLFGGIFFHPGTDTLGSQTIGEMLLSWLPNGGSGFDLDGGDASVTSLLEAFGLLNW